MPQRHWGGLANGFLGTATVVSAHKTGSGPTFHVMVPAFAALADITVGTLWQKCYCLTFDLRTSTVVQYAASLLVTALMTTKYSQEHGGLSAPKLGAVTGSANGLHVSHARMPFTTLPPCRPVRRIRRPPLTMARFS